MGRIRRAWYYQRKAQQAERREQFLRNREPRTEGYKPRPERKDAVYASACLTAPGAANRTSLLFKVKYPDAKGLTPNDLGLYTVQEKPDAVPIRSAPIYPTTARWFEGTSNPQRVTTQWGTAWIRYYEPAQGNQNSHYSAPLSAKGDRITPESQLTTFNQLFEGAKKTTLLGGKNGRAYLVLERLKGYGAS